MFFAYYHDYVIDLGPEHRFPMQKYALLYNRLLQERTPDDSRLFSPQPAALRDLALVHSVNYISHCQAGHMTEKEIRRLGLPWPPLWPIVVIMGGGHAPDIDLIVDAHFSTVRAAARVLEIAQANRINNSFDNRQSHNISTISR